MRRSVPILIAFALTVASCAAKKPQAPPVEVLAGPATTTAVMTITPDIPISTKIATPHGLVPIAGRPPLWLLGNKEIALVGSVDGRTKVIGFSGKDYSHSQVIAADHGMGAPDGTIMDIAASPNGLTIAVAESEPGKVEVVIRDLISAGKGHPVAAFDGNFRSASLFWLDSGTVALTLGTNASPAPQASGDDTQNGARAPTAADDASETVPPNGGLFLIGVYGAVTVRPVALKCPLSAMRFSPGGLYAVTEGDTATPPQVYSRLTGRCRPLGIPGPIRLLGWAPDDQSFLYAAPAIGDHGPGVFRYDTHKHGSDVVAIASAAAVYLQDGSILALGNRSLSWRSVAANPDAPFIAQLALFSPKLDKTQVESLGRPTSPVMLSQSAMVYSQPFDEAAIELYRFGPHGPEREIVTFSRPDQKAFVIASGPIRGTVTLAWVPNTDRLLIFDGDGTSGGLTILSPPR